MKQDTRKLIGGTELVLTPGDPRVMFGGRRAILRLKELEMLEVLAREPGRLINTATLAKQLGHGQKPLSKTTVAVHIHRLRIRLKPVGLTIRSFRGAGPWSPARRVSRPVNTLRLERRSRSTLVRCGPAWARESRRRRQSWDDRIASKNS